MPSALPAILLFLPKMQHNFSAEKMLLFNYAELLDYLAFVRMKEFAS